MRRFAALILTFVLALSLCACTKGHGASSGSDLTQAEIERILAREEAAG